EIGCAQGTTLDPTNVTGSVSSEPMTCADQVEVTSFTASPAPSLMTQVDIPGNQLNLFTQVGQTKGITFTAQVTVNTGTIPVDHVHLFYIQNVLQFFGIAQYNPPPSIVAGLAMGISFPILDWCNLAQCPTLPTLPDYNSDFTETNP